MTLEPPPNRLIQPQEAVLVTGSTGFIGRRVVRSLLQLGCRNVRCFVRPSSGRAALEEAARDFPATRIEIVEGNLLYREDCEAAARGVSVIVHLAAGGDKSFSGSVLSCAVTTKNLLEAALSGTRVLRRFVNVSSFSVYSPGELKRGAVVDETCPLESRPFERSEAYCYGKMRQEKLVLEYAERHGVPYVILRPGWVYGPGRTDLSGRIGIDTFGFFMHLGGGNTVPLTYVDNCADAIALAAVLEGVDGQVLNVVDDELATSRQFLRSYKSNVGRFKSLYLPYPLFYGLSYLWEKYAEWSKDQVPPVFNRLRCKAYWRRHQYSNVRLKEVLGWEPQVSLEEGCRRFFSYVKASR